MTERCQPDNFPGGARQAARRRLVGWVCGGLALAAVALALHWRGFIHALDEPHDGLLYVSLAAALMEGRWLGEYNHLTLIRQPVYSLFLAANGLLEFRLHLTQYLLTVTGGLFLALSLRRLGLSDARTLLLLGLVLFHPVFLAVSLFAATEALYVPLTLCWLAGGIGLLATARGPWPSHVAWSLLFACSLALLWHTRSESLWLLPPLLFIWLGAAKLHRGTWRRRLAGMSLVVLLPLFAILALDCYIKTKNEAKYGVPVTHELAEENFARAFKQLSRVAPEHHRPYVPVPRLAMREAFGASPTFARLEPFLEAQFDGRGWSRPGYLWMGIKDELVNGWFMWAVRDGAALLGEHAEAPRASLFYGRIADEIALACEQGLIACTANPTGNLLAPPLVWTDLPRLPGSVARVSWLALAMGGWQGFPDFAPAPHAGGPVAARYAAVSHDQRAETPWFAGRWWPLLVVFYTLLHVAAVLAVMTVLPRGCFAGRRGKAAAFAEPVKIVLALCLLVVLSRLAVVVYLDAFSFYAQVRYLFPVYPALLVLLTLAFWPDRSPSGPLFQEKKCRKV